MVTASGLWASPPGAALAAIAGSGHGLPGIGRRAAQQLARRELSKPVYHSSAPLIDRVLEAVARWLNRVFQAAGNSVPGKWWGLVALAALAVIAAAALMAWMGPVARTRRGQRPLAAGAGPRTARDHRASAELSAQAGDYTSAIRERLRAIAAELHERGLVPARPGWTALEFASEAGRVLPAHADPLRGAAEIFDEVCYGQRTGTARACERLRELDEAIRASAPKPRTAVQAPLAPAGSGRRSP